MPQIGGKDKSKSSKSSSTSKRHFTVVIGTKEHGLYCSSSPSSAARKAVSKLCAKEKGKKVEFCLREITQGSKKKTYGPYLGHIEKLAKPIELKGRVIEHKPVALLKSKSSTKKGGMRGGDVDISLNNGKKLNISLGNCGRSHTFGVWKNDCITLRYNQKKVVLYYNNVTKKIEVRIFNKISSDVYHEKQEIELTNFNSNTITSILTTLFNRSESTKVVKINDKLINPVIAGILNVCSGSNDSDLIIVKNIMISLRSFGEINIQTQHIPDPNNDVITVTLSNCGRSRRSVFWKNGCVTLIGYNKKVVLYYNEDTQKIEIRYFKNRSNNVYNNKYEFPINDFNFDVFKDNVFYYIVDTKYSNYEIEDNEDNEDNTIKQLIDEILRIINDNNCHSINCEKIYKALLIIKEQINKHRKEKVLNSVRFMIGNDDL
jgi:hypothetical protein